MTLYYLEAQMQLRRHMIFIQNLGDDKNIFASHRSFCRITHEIQTLNLSLDWWSIVLRPVREHVTYVYNCEWRAARFTQKLSVHDLSLEGHLSLNRSSVFEVKSKGLPNQVTFTDMQRGIGVLKIVFYFVISCRVQGKSCEFHMIWYDVCAIKIKEKTPNLCDIILKPLGINPAEKNSVRIAENDHHYLPQVSNMVLA